MIRVWMALALVGASAWLVSGATGEAEPRDLMPEASVLRAAVVQGDLEGVRAALAAGAAPDAAVDGTTVLQVAAREGDSRIVDVLLDAGADPDLPDAAGLTAVHHAAAADRAGALAALAGRGAHVDARDHDGRTPLDAAVAARAGDAAAFLVALTAPCRLCARG